MKEPNAILCSDFHLREDTPICRADNFWETQWRKVDFVSDLQKQYNCPVLHAGDLFHRWKPSPYLLSATMEHLPNKFYTIYGQHDLPQHNLELKYKSGIYVLEKAGKLETMDYCSWGQKPKDISSILCGTKEQKILVWHNFTYMGKEPFPGAKGRAHVLLEKHKQFDLIVTGDNHQSFHVLGLNGNLLVNPGCLTRQRANEEMPKVYLWYAETNTVEAIEVPAKRGVVTREHIEKVEERDERIEAFISRLEMEWDKALSFEENMKNFFETNRVRKEVKSIIHKAMEND